MSEEIPTIEERIARLYQHLQAAQAISGEIQKEMVRDITDDTRHAIGNVVDHAGKAAGHARYLADQHPVGA